MQATLVRLVESRPAMRMWRFLDRLALIQEMERSFYFDRVLSEDDESKEETHKRLLGLLRDVQVSHHHLSDEESAKREKELHDFLEDQAQKERAHPSYKGVVHVRNPETGKLEAHPETPEEHSLRFRLRGLPERRADEGPAEFEHRKQRWLKGHRGEGMDVKSVHSAEQLMREPAIQEILKGQRGKAARTEDLPHPSLVRTEKARKVRGVWGKEVEETKPHPDTGKPQKKISSVPLSHLHQYSDATIRKAQRLARAGRTPEQVARATGISSKHVHDAIAAKRIGSQAGEAIGEKGVEVGTRAPELKKTQEEHRDNPPNKIYKLSKKQEEELDNLRTSGQGAAAQKQQEAWRKEARDRWQRDQVHSDTGEVVAEAGYKLHHRDLEHGGGKKKFKEVRGEQPPPGGWSRQHPAPGTMMHRGLAHAGGVTARAQAVGRGGVSEPAMGVGSGAMNAVKAILYTGHGEFQHHDPDVILHGKDLARRAIKDREEHLKAHPGDKIPTDHPEFGFATIARKSGLTEGQVKALARGTASIPIQAIAHQARRRFDPDYEGYVKPDDAGSKKKKKFAKAPEDDEASDENEDEDEDTKETHLSPSWLGKAMARVVSKRSKTGQEKAQSAQVDRWRGIEGKGETGEGAGTAGLSSDLGKQEERKRVPVASKTDVLLKHPGDMPEQGKTSDVSHARKVRDWAGRKLDRKRWNATRQKAGEDTSDEAYEKEVDAWLKAHPQAKAEHENLTRLVYGEDERHRKATIHPSKAAKTLLHPRGALWDEVQRAHEAAGGKGSYKGVSHRLPLDQQVLQHAARLLKRSTDATLHLGGLTGRSGDEITRGARGEHGGKLYTGAASGLPHGEPLRKLLSKEAETEKEGEETESPIKERPVRTVSGPGRRVGSAAEVMHHAVPGGPSWIRERPLQREPLTFSEHAREQLEKALEHVFPTKLQTLAKGGEAGKAHFSTTRAAHPSKLKKGEAPDDTPKEMWGAEHGYGGGFGLRGQKLVDDFNEAEARSRFRKKQPQEPKPRKGSKELTDKQKKSHEKKLAAYQQELASHVENERKAHGEQQAAWHKFLSGAHGDVQGVLRDIFSGVHDANHPNYAHTLDFYKKRNEETTGERKRRVEKEGASRVESDLLRHHLKAAKKNPEYLRRLGIEGEKAEKHASSAFNNLLKRLQREGGPAFESYVRSIGATRGPQQKITRTPLTSAQRREKAQRRAGMEPPSEARAQASKEAEEKLAAQQKSSAQSFASRVQQVATTRPAEPRKPAEKSTITVGGVPQTVRSRAVPSKPARTTVSAADLTPLAGHARSAGEPLAAGPPAPVKKTITIPAAHAAIINKYRAAKKAYDAAPGPKRGSGNPFYRALVAARQALKSIGHDPRNLPGGPTNLPHPVAPSTRDPSSYAATVTAAGQIPTHTGTQIAPEGSRAHAAQTRAAIWPPVPHGERGPRAPEPESEEGKKAEKQSRRREAELAHMAHEAAVKEHEPHVQNFVSARERIADLKAQGVDETDSRMIEAKARHAKHGDFLMGKGVNLAKISAPSPSEERAKSEKVERERRRKPGPGQVRTTKPIVTRKRVKPPEREPEQTRTEPEHFETPPAFKMASIMKPKEGRKLFVPTPEQRSAAVAGGPAPSTPSGGSRKPLGASLKSRKEKKSLLKFSSGGTARTSHEQGGHVETVRHEPIGGVTRYSTYHTHPEHGTRGLGNTPSLKQATRIHKKALSRPFPVRGELPKSALAAAKEVGQEEAAPREEKKKNTDSRKTPGAEAEETEESLFVRISRSLQESRPRSGGSLFAKVCALV